jgi:hypothetical protein
MRRKKNRGKTREGGGGEGRRAGEMLISFFFFWKDKGITPIRLIENKKSPSHTTPQRFIRIGLGLSMTRPRGSRSLEAETSPYNCRTPGKQLVELSGTR